MKKVTNQAQTKANENTENIFKSPYRGDLGGLYLYLKKPIIPRRILALLVLAFFFTSPTLQAVTNYYFHVQFVNKNNTPYSLANPAAFLSDRAIERRAQLGIPIDSTDLPVNPVYIKQIADLNIPIHSRSKWMNAVTVMLTDSSMMNQVRNLSCVKEVQYTGKISISTAVEGIKLNAKASANYGYANTQIDQLNGKYLHDLGFKGRNIHVGVIDAGFNNVDINPAFDSLRLQDRLLGTKDIINPTSDIYAEDTHGAHVLSTMAGNLPNLFLGTAPDASYWLIRTEYGPSEYLVETDFWCAGIEFADSVGVDVVNSSLGYSVFDDTRMNFTYADMNGRVCRASRAATMAAQKGIIVVNSAGNEGNKTWHYLSAPSDATGIVTVGAVTTTGSPSAFSSFGPSSDNRVKPEICAVGTSSAIVDTNGIPTYGDGTSYSSPIMAGMMACFLQASRSICPGCSIDTILDAVFGSGSLFEIPTAQLGYGIPDFQTALARLPFFNSVKMIETADLVVAYNKSDKSIRIRLFEGQINSDRIVRVYSITGSLQIQQRITEPETILQGSKLNTGMYLIQVSGNGKSFTNKIIVR